MKNLIKCTLLGLLSVSTMALAQSTDHRLMKDDVSNDHASSRFICISKYNDGRSPYTVGVQNALDLSIIKTNLIYNDENECRDAIESSVIFNDKAYVCASKYKDEAPPYSIYTIHGNVDTQLQLIYKSTQLSQLTYSDADSCQIALARAKITPQVLGICAPKYGSKASSWSLLAVHHHTNAISNKNVTFSSRDDCERGL